MHDLASFSSATPTDRSGTVSPSSVAGARGAQSPGHSSPRPDSPSLGASAGQEPASAVRGESGVSGLSEYDRAHLRQASDTTVSSVNTVHGRLSPAATMVPDNSPEAAGGLSPRPSAPISPASPDQRE